MTFPKRSPGLVPRFQGLKVSRLHYEPLTDGLGEPSSQASLPDKIESAIMLRKLRQRRDSTLALQVTLTKDPSVIFDQELRYLSSDLRDVRAYMESAFGTQTAKSKK